MPDNGQTEPINEGCYRLINLLNREVLDLSDGNWKYGRTQTWGYTRDGSVINQRWLMAKTPGDQTFLIINLFAGVLLGVFRGERDQSNEVHAGPVGIMPWWQRWSFKQNPDKSWNLWWRQDLNKVLDCAGGQSHGKVLVYDDHGGDNQRWLLEGQDVDNVRRLSQWMHHVPGNTRLSMLNYVGTHQSLALRRKNILGELEAENPHCQDLPPYEQFMDGVRYLDCRFERWQESGEEDVLYAKHGIAEQGYTWLAVLMSVQVFLHRFPTETIMVAVSIDGYSEEKKGAFWVDFKVFWDYNQNLVYTYARPPSSSTNPNRKGYKTKSDVTLDEVRGKMILLVGQGQMDGVHEETVYATPQEVWVGLNEPSGKAIDKDHQRSWNEDQYDWGWLSYGGKQEACEKMTKKAKDDSNASNIYSVSWNVSRLGSYDPIVGFLGLESGINEVYRNVGVNGQYRIGAVYFDFYHRLPDTMANIVRSNHGCGDL